jgi:hypothetical protein
MLGIVADLRNGDDACHTKQGYCDQCHETLIRTHVVETLVSPKRFKAQVGSPSCEVDETPLRIDVDEFDANAIPDVEPG